MNDAIQERAQDKVGQGDGPAVVLATQAKKTTGNPFLQVGRA